ncbi:uncharacterized protein BX664DRAFT_319901 [Halteromyces radiatus]|uniref:uncharacterized protein n=1 Tax=Halteromyces radiatus TaxID=101107 RepID=UPI00221E7F1B|nr:uncharacterized protein BX664DRAFT_319901 [Halteromyces radiatus]KAI8098908.1 hypothetical protein BX664DRAFT_319901 [Halteromyces radiatus]
MIWRSDSIHQDYMKHDVQSMTSKFSVRPTKTRLTGDSIDRKDKVISSSTNPIMKTTQNTTLEFVEQGDSHEEEEEEDDDDDDEVEDMEDDDPESGEDKSAPTTPPLPTTTIINTPTSPIKATRPPNQVLYLNFTSDLSPHTSRQRKKGSQTNKSAYRVNGVNILNRKNLDSKTVVERIQRRKENHNHVERRRRDTINNIILELSQVVPNAMTTRKPHKGNILKATLEYVMALKAENEMYRSRLASRLPPPSSTSPITSSATTLPGTLGLSSGNSSVYSNPVVSSPPLLPSTSLFIPTTLPEPMPSATLHQLQQPQQKQ